MGEDPPQPGLVDQRDTRGDSVTVAPRRRRRPHHEVVIETVHLIGRQQVIRFVLDSDHVVVWHIPRRLTDWAHEREPDRPLAALGDHGAGQVRAVGVTDHEERLLGGNAIDEAEEHSHDIVVARQPLCRGSASHTREIGVDPAVPAPASQDRFQPRLDLAMIDTGSMQPKHGQTAAVLNEMHLDTLNSALHTRTLLT